MPALEDVGFVPMEEDVGFQPTESSPLTPRAPSRSRTGGAEALPASEEEAIRAQVPEGDVPGEIGQEAHLPRLGKKGTMLLGASDTIAGLGEWALNNPEEAALTFTAMAPVIAVKYGVGVVKQVKGDVLDALGGDREAMGRLAAFTALLGGGRAFKAARDNYLAKGPAQGQVEAPEEMALRASLPPSAVMEPSTLVQLPLAPLVQHDALLPTASETFKHAIQTEDAGSSPTATKGVEDASKEQSAATPIRDVLRSDEGGALQTEQVPEGVAPSGEGVRRNENSGFTEAEAEVAPPSQASEAISRQAPTPESEVSSSRGTGDSLGGATESATSSPPAHDLEALAKSVGFERTPPDHGALGITPTSYQQVLEIGQRLEHLREGFSALWQARPNKAEITRARDAADTLANTEGRQVYNSLRLAGSLADREAAYAIVESDFDYHKLGVFVNQARGKNARAERAARRAMTDYDRLRPLADKVSQILEAQINMERAQGFNVEDRQAYVPHIIDTDLLMGSKRPVVLAGGGGGSGSTGFKKGRTFATIYDAIEQGYQPRTIDVAKAVEHRVRAGQEMINKKAWVDSLRGMVDPVDHQPLVVNPVRRDYGGARPPDEVAPMGYVIREAAPGMRIAVHEGYARIFDALTGHSAIAQSLAGKAILNVEGALKHGLLLFDTYHASRILQKELFLTRGAGGYRKGYSLLEYSDADLDAANKAGEITPEMEIWVKANRTKADLLMHAGLNVGRIEEALYSGVARQIPIIGGFNKWVFDKVTRGAMMESGLIEFDRLRANMPGASDAEVAARAATRLNQLYGNLGRQGVFKSATFRDLARIIALAPQWVEGMARTEAGAVREGAQGALKGKPLEGTLARSVGQGLLAYVVGTQLLNLATRGKPTWENEEKGHKLDAWIPDVTGKTAGFFLSPLSVVAELSHDVVRYAHSEGSLLKAGMKILANKLSPLAHGEETLRTGRDYKGEKITSDWERVKTAVSALSPTPIGVSAVGQQDNAGKVQRQVTAMLGVKTEPAPTADAQVHDLARAWESKSPDAKVRNAAEKREREGYAAGDYTALRKALRTGDMEAAHEEYTKVLQLHSAKQINDAMLPNRPVTGSRRMEGAFRASLSPEELKIYNKAVEERRAVQRAYFQLRAALSAGKAQTTPTK